jgi:LacI family transcriptional regulator
MVTIRTIAAKAGVSIGTVDRVIHNRGKVAPETETRVRQILKELDYKPNLFARNLKLRKTFTFGILMPELDQDSKYWENPVKGINKAQSDLKGHKVNIKFFHYDKYSEKSFKATAQQLLETNLDGLLIAPVSTNAFQEFIQRIPLYLPYVFFDSDIPDTKCLSYIGQDAYQSGILAAKLMSQIISDRGNLVVLRVLPEDYHIIRRANGFYSYFKHNNKYRIVTYDVDGNGDQKLFKTYFKKIISENTNLQGIFVTNVSTHKIADQIKDMPSEGRIRLIGYDLIEENIRYLKEGIIDYIIIQSPEMQGYQGIYTLYRHVVLNEKVDTKMMMQLDIVTKENIDYYQNFERK